MQFEWILNPLTQYAVIGLGLAGSLGLWIASKVEVSGVRNEVSGSRGAMETHIRELSARVNQLQVSREEEQSYVPAAGGVVQGLNLTKRAQVVRMHRRGETVPSIAGALQTPVNEVELILKMEKLLNARMQSAPAPASDQTALSGLL
jgi:hypothetical protein